MDRAEAVRAALDAPDWNQRSATLGELGLGVRPFLAPSKNGPRLRGIVVFDLVNETNAIAASKFDTRVVKYGMAALDFRRDLSTPVFADWWQSHRPPSAPAATKYTGQQIRYAEAHERHAADEARKVQTRALIEQRFLLHEHELRKALMARRRTQAKQLSVAERRAFYAAYDDSVRRPQLENLRARRRVELAPLTRKQMPSFATWKRQMARITASLRFKSDTTPFGEGGAIISLGRAPSLATILALASAPLLSKARADRSNMRGVKLLGDQLSVAVDALANYLAAVDPASLERGGSQHVSSRFEQDVMFEHESAVSPRVALLDPIDGYHPRSMPGGVKYARRGEAPAFVERGARITVKIDSDDALRAALKLALTRTTGAIVVSADAAVLERIYGIADALGARARLIDGAVEEPRRRGPKR